MTGLLIDGLVFVHIAAGLVCLAAGPVALASYKGGPVHRRWGKAYLALMLTLAGTASVLLALRWDTFFFLLSVLSFYLAFSGRRVLLRKRPERGQAAAPLDWLAALATVLVGVVAVWLGALGGLGADAAAVLGILSPAVVTAVYDLWRFARPLNTRLGKGLWLVEHLAKLAGSYIAVVAAFSGTVLTFLPLPWGQIWPALMGTPPLVYAAARTWRRFNRAGA